MLPRGEAVTSERLLTAYGTLVGFMTAGGRPDYATPARILLKAPPGVIQDDFHQFLLEVS